MKKKNFKVKKFGEPKATHETKHVDLITQYNRMRSIVIDIYGSDFFAMATKKEQKEIEASVACILRTLLSMIGLDAIDRTDNLPDDSGNATDKDIHDSIEKMKNIAYGNTETNGVKKAAARRALNLVYGTPSSIMVMNRKILSELGAKRKLNSVYGAIGSTECTDDDSDTDEVKKFEVNLGNFTDGPSSYGQQYLDICKQYGFDAAETLKQIEKLASYYYIQMISLVDVVDSQDEITADKYTLEPGSVFFVTNKKDSSKSPVFILVYMQPYTKTKSFDVSRFSIEIAPEHRTEESTNLEDLEESTKTNDIEFIGSDAYYDIGKVHLGQNTVIDLDATLEKIKDEARKHGISTVTFVHTIGNSLDIFTEGKYTLESGVLFYHRGNEWLNFMLVVEDEDIPDKVHVCIINPVEKPEENANLDDIEFINIYAYYSIDNTNPNYTIDLDATFIKIKEKAKEKGIKRIRFVDSISKGSEVFDKSKYSLEVGSLFYIKNHINLANFILVTETGDAPSDTRIQVIKSVTKSVEDNSDYESGSHDAADVEVEFEYTPYESRYINDLATSFMAKMAKNDIEFVGADDYYNIDKSYPNSTIIDLDATLAKIKEMARAKNIKTITFLGIIKGFHEAYYKGNNSQVGSFYYLKNDERPMFILITGNIDYVNLPMHEDIDPVVVKKDDPEGESDSKEDGIEAVEAEDEIVDSDEASSDYCVNDQYADMDTSTFNHDLYTKVSFPIFMKPTVTGANASFANICDIYGFDISETIKRIKNVAYLVSIEDVIYIDSFNSFDEIFKTDLPTRYGYCDGYLFFINASTKDKQDPCFAILYKTYDDSEFDAILYRINPIKRPASIYQIKKIDVIDTYADGDVRIADGLESVIGINHAYKLKEICDKRNYDYDSVISCLKGVTAIIGGGSWLTFEGTVDSLNWIVLVDPVVAYNTCSVFFVDDFVGDKKEPYFVIYMPITGKTKNGYSFHLYRIYPILNQDPNTDSQDESNVREINQFTSINRANLEVSEADKDAYMKVEFSNIDYNDGMNQSLVNICYMRKFKFYDTIKRIRFVAYMNNFKEIKYAGTARSHEEILEKEVLYGNGSVVFVSDAEDPHFVIVEFIDGYSCLNRINPVKE